MNEEERMAFLKLQARLLVLEEFVAEQTEEKLHFEKIIREGYSDMQGQKEEIMPRSEKPARDRMWKGSRKNRMTESEAAFAVIIWWLANGRGQSESAADKMRALSRQFPSNANGFMRMAVAIEGYQDDDCGNSVEYRSGVPRGTYKSKPMPEGFYKKADA